jgi:hypothetical protein
MLDEGCLILEITSEVKPDASEILEHRFVLPPGGVGRKPQTSLRVL